MNMQNTAQNLKLDERNHVENAARSTPQQALGDGSATRHGTCKLMIHNKNPPEPAENLLYQTKTGRHGWKWHSVVRPAGFHSTSWQSSSSGTSQSSPGISRTFLMKANWRGNQLLQNLQQLPLTAKHIRSITSTSMSSFQSATG